MRESNQEQNREFLENFSVRLNTLIEERRLKLNEIADACGVSVSTVSGWRTAKWLPRGNASKLLADFLNVSADFLLYGKTAKDSSYSIISEAAQKYGSNVQIQTSSLIWVPVVSWAQAGQAESFDELPAEWQELIPVDCPDKHAFAIRLVGDSMEPEHREGEIAVVMPSHQPKNGCLVVARLKNDGVLFKRFFVEDAEQHLFRLSSYNPVYPSQVYPENSFSWIYPVWSVQRRVW
ncbi:MAG: XRE family transcriptional regulator [Verrucomicrobiota bacterium]